MAIDPSTQVTNTNGATAAFPYGSAKDVSTPGAGDGTPALALWVNDNWGFLQAILDEAGLVPTGTPDQVGASQYLDGLKAIAGGGGRLVKRLLTSGTLTINESANDKVAAYLTSTEIKSGDYLVFAHGAGGSGGDKPSSTRGGGGGGGGGTDYGVLTINSSTAFVIGAGSPTADTAGGDTTISTLTGGGGGGGGIGGGIGGTGNYLKGQGGGPQAYNVASTASPFGGKGGGLSGGEERADGGLSSGGGGGGGASTGAQGAGGDGYIEIYEWS